MILNWIYNLRNYFRLRKRLFKALSELRPKDIINVRLPRGYFINEDNGIKYFDVPASHVVHNNDPLARTIWLKLAIKDGVIVNRMYKYSSLYLRDFILLNVEMEDQPELSNSVNTKDLNKELEKAVNNDNFELAQIINDKIKKSK